MGNQLDESDNDDSGSEGDDGVNDNEAINARYEYIVVDDCVHNENGAEEEETCNEHGVINNSEQREAASLLEGQRNYSDMTPIHAGPVTGVQVKFS